MSDKAAAVDDEAFASFVARVEPRLREALLSAYGSDRGRVAVVTALHYAYQHWVDVFGLADPIPTLYRAGRDRTRKWRGPRSLGSGDLALALAQMPWRSRLALVLGRAFDWSLEDVAALTATPAATVPARVANGLAALELVAELEKDPTRLDEALRVVVLAAAQPVSAGEAVAGAVLARTEPGPLRRGLRRRRALLPGAAMAVVALGFAALAFVLPGKLRHRSVATPPNPFAQTLQCPAAFQPSCSVSPGEAARLLGHPIASPRLVPAGLGLVSEVVSLGRARSYNRAWGLPGNQLGQISIQLTIYFDSDNIAVATIGPLLSYSLDDGIVARGNIGGATAGAAAQELEGGFASVGEVTGGLSPTGSLMWKSRGAFFVLTENGLTTAQVLAFANSLS